MSEMIAPRDVFSETILKLRRQHDNIVVLDADVLPSNKLRSFAEEFPNALVQVGIAEQNMVGIAAGLSTIDIVPFATTFACFLSRRAYDQVTLSVAYPKLNVKLVGTYCGLFSGKNGATHQSLEDIAIMRALPNMVVLVPADAIETEQMTRFCYSYNGPVYFRIPRDPIPDLIPPDYKYQLGKSTTLRQGRDASIISIGVMTHLGLQAAEELRDVGINVKVINMSTVKPIDNKAIIDCARQTGAIVTVENHNIVGGLGSAVAEVLGENFPVPFKRIGVEDRFGKSGTNEQMMEYFGLTVGNIKQTVLDIIKRKSKKE